MQSVSLDLSQNATELIKKLHENYKKFGPCTFKDSSSDNRNLTEVLQHLGEVPVDILEAYVQDVTDGPANVWYDDENAYAGLEAFWMVSLNLSTMPLYVNFLSKNDMDHEVFQTEYIDEIIETHGINSETLHLIAARMGCCIGQHGAEQVEEIWEENEINELLIDNENIRNSFILHYAKCQFVWAVFELSRKLHRGATIAEFTEALQDEKIDLWENTFLEDLEEYVDEELFELLKPQIDTAFITQLNQCDQSLIAYDVIQWGKSI